MSEHRASEGDNARAGLFFQLFMAYQPNLFAYILASVHNYSDAEDILQETAIVMWSRFGEFEQGSNFAAWGVAIARNLVLKFFNDHKRSRIQFDNDLMTKLLNATLDETKHTGPLKDALRHCFAKLSEVNQKLLQLRYKDCMTIKDIANRTGRPIQGMYKAYARLQDALQRCIETVLKSTGLA